MDGQQLCFQVSPTAQQRGRIFKKADETHDSIVFKTDRRKTVN